MNSFAHNGVVHATNAEATAHIITDAAKLVAFALATSLIILISHRLYKILSFSKVDTNKRKVGK